MEAQPQRLEEAIIAIWELRNTDTCCDGCPRKAKYQGYVIGKDVYVCRLHVLRIMEYADQAIRKAKYAA